MKKHPDGVGGLFHRLLIAWKYQCWRRMGDRVREMRVGLFLVEVGLRLTSPNYDQRLE